jgi:hypothetical protein
MGQQLSYKTGSLERHPRIWPTFKVKPDFHDFRNSLRAELGHEAGRVGSLENQALVLQKLRAPSHVAKEIRARSGVCCGTKVVKSDKAVDNL